MSIESVTKRFGSLAAVDDVSLEIRENEFFALLGPSGCGKTTLLRMLAGFEWPDAGRILLDGHDLAGVRPYRRPLNMMFQSYALFPHLTVERNVAYGLEAEKLPKAEIRASTSEALAMVQLSQLADRKPAQLSGGQRQRVALARALVKRPKLLLLDEPLSALDRQIRQEMQIELKRLQASLGITFVVVTHDQEEALGLADRVGVMRAGRIVQIGSPQDLYEAPASQFVASFLGESNLIAGRISDDLESLIPARLHQRLPLPPSSGTDAGRVAGAPVALMVRPEQMVIGVLGSDIGPCTIEGDVAEVVYLGSTRKVIVRLGDGSEVIVRAAGRSHQVEVEVGSRVLVGWSPDAALLIDEQEPDVE